ncbi:MAG: YdhR family protein [Caldilineaceae bacterium]|nr:YdhR family protein [Caldilineaceae bacterium]
MAQQIVQINFEFSGSRAGYEEANLPYAAPIAAIPGMRWKIWLMNEAGHEAGGLYLFDDEAAAQAFLDSPVVAGLKEDPSLRHLSIKQFDILPAHTSITRGPVAAAQAMPKTFSGMAGEALVATPTISPAEAYRQLQENPNTLVIDVRDAADIAATGTILGAINISYGALTYSADNEVPDAWRDPRLADRTRPIITTCILGPLGALGGKLLHDMGFTDVKILEGGVQAWIDAGLPVAR